MSIKATEKQLLEAREVVTQLEAKLAEQYSMPVEYVIANELHSILCRSNHEDMCGWFFEFKGPRETDPNWTASTHGRYLASARKLVCYCKELNIEPSLALDIARAVNSY